jgi:hypothetical protein
LVKVMSESDIDSISNEVDDAIMTATEVAMAEASVATMPSSQQAGDLSDGGTVGGVTLSPMVNGKKVEEGRPAARQAWMWNGTATLLPLTWNTDGTMHDGARKYLLKRHCLCCKTGGFRAAQCPNCVKSRCHLCHASTKPKTVIACFYLTKDAVPFPTRFYGDIDCFLKECARRGEGAGFLTEQDMRFHARSRHKLEYEAFQEAQESVKGNEMADLKAQINAMMLVQAQNGSAPAPEIVVESDEDESIDPVIGTTHPHRYATGRRGSPCIAFEGCASKRQRKEYKKRVA